MGFLGEGLRYLVGTPLGTADLRRLVKNCGDALNILVCTRGKTFTKKRNVYAVRVTFHPCVVLTHKPLVTPLCVWGPMGNIITLAQYQLNRFRG